MLNAEFSKPPLERKDIASIRNVVEQVAAEVLLGRGGQVYYEPIVIPDVIEGSRRSTRPDFCVVDPETGEEEYFEVTLSSEEKLWCDAHKLRQEAILRRNGLRCQVWGRETLQREWKILRGIIPR